MQALGPARPRAAESFRAIVMRKDPPFDQDYLTATWWLDRAALRTVVVNAPAGLRELSEKLSILPFPELTPRTYMLRARDDLRAALRELGGRMILKPLYGHGGRGVLIAREGDASAPRPGVLVAHAWGGRDAFADGSMPAVGMYYDRDGLEYSADEVKRDYNHIEEVD